MLLLFAFCRRRTQQAQLQEHRHRRQQQHPSAAQLLPTATTATRTAAAAAACLPLSPTSLVRKRSSPGSCFQTSMSAQSRCSHAWMCCGACMTRQGTDKLGCCSWVSAGMWAGYLLAPALLADVALDAHFGTPTGRVFTQMYCTAAQASYQLLHLCALSCSTLCTVSSSSSNCANEAQAGCCYYQQPAVPCWRHKPLLCRPAGDFWDRRGDLPVIPLNSIQQEMASWQDTPLLMLPGNHDQVGLHCAADITAEANLGTAASQQAW